MISEASLRTSLRAEFERITLPFPSMVDAHSEGMIMSLRQLIGRSAAALVGTGALLASVATSQAAMLPVSHLATPYVQYVDCAIGAHVGPLGACIIGSDDSPPVVVEHRVDAPNSQSSDGCSTKSVTKTDGTGDTETHTKTNC